MSDLKKIWITGFPTGKAMIVEILGDHPSMEGGVYIRKPNGGSDTTTSKFLFDLPEEIQQLTAKVEALEKYISEIEYLYGVSDEDKAKLTRVNKT